MSKVQLTILGVLSALLIGTTSPYWIQYPDSGYYLGTASNMLNSFNYWFNGQPNLQYYPGTSIVISLPLWLFGENFLALQGFMAFVSLIGIFIIARYFTPSKYGVVGLLTPFFVLTSSLFLIHFYALISDTLFLTITLLALLMWRKYEESDKTKYLIICCCLVAFSSVVRLQGLFFCGALGLALMIHAYQYHRDNLVPSMAKMMTIGALVCLPFVLWTARNYLAHTPDAFNMANGYFFGLKGLDIYAKGLPGNASAEHIQASWQFPLERTSLFLGGLFESWYGGVSTINRYAITVIMLVLIGLGVGPWAKKANKLELLYVGFSMLFIFKDILLNKNLHIVYRYWLPMMPFIIVILGMGIKTCVSFTALKGFKKPAQYTALLTVGLLLALSTPNLLKMYEQSDKFHDEQLLIEEMKAFTDQHIPKDSIVATVDWGVLPHSLQRRSIPLLNDPDNAQSIQRMLKYQTEYLVTYSKFGRMSDPAEEMVKRYQSEFELLFESPKNNPKTYIKIYKVDLTGLSNISIN